MVRSCGQRLERDDRRLVCPNGHAFDRAKQGYWPLLQPQDRHSPKAGDCDEAVQARNQWLARGFADGLIDKLRPWMEQTRGQAPKPTSTLDLGCGEGYIAPRLFAGQDVEYCGIDLSKKAIKLAARNWPEATWVLANADRTLPAADQGVDRVISLFARRPLSEIQRVLVPDGWFVVAVPGVQDLAQIRMVVQGRAVERDRTNTIISECAQQGLALVQHETWLDEITMDESALLDSMAMTYRGARNSQSNAFHGVDSMQVSLHAELLLFQKQADVP